MSTFEVRVSQITFILRRCLEQRFGSDEYGTSRSLVAMLRRSDQAKPGFTTPAILQKVLTNLNIEASMDECSALIERIGDTGEEIPKELPHKTFADAVAGVTVAPRTEPRVCDLIGKCVKFLVDRNGENGVHGLSRMFRLMDTDHNNTLSPEELFNGFQRYGVRISERDCQSLVKFFDRDGDGSITLTEFNRALRGHMPECRLEFVKIAFGILDRDGDGTVTMDELKLAYDATRHPSVLDGTKTLEDVIKDFVSGWDKDGDGQITFDEFLDYYKDISAGIQLDSYFELMMRNCWHISGGEGVSENTTCRRVLVTFEDGSERILEIKNDLGIDKTDIPKMRKNLEEQGITGIAQIQISAKV